MPEKAFAGFDGFPESSDGTFYANRILRADMPPELKRRINDDVISMFEDFHMCDKGRTKITFVTQSMYLMRNSLYNKKHS